MDTRGKNAIAAAVEGAEPPAPAEDGSLDLELFAFPRNDYGNGQRLIRRFGRDLMYVRGHGWYCWDGKRWRMDEEGHHAQQLAHNTFKAIAGEMKAYRMWAMEKGYHPEQVQERCERHKKWATASGNATRVKAMVGEAMPYLERDIDALDADPYLFNTESGTLDLRNGEVKLRRFRREDLITKIADTGYDERAVCPVFRAFLDTVLPNAQEQAFAQRYFGYALTGLISEQKLLLCWGGGRNGKSTLTLAIKELFGDYASMLPFESLLQDDRRRGSEATPDLARLPGKRFVLASEPEQGARLSTSIMKRMTGGEPMVVRDLNKGFFEFDPQFKLVLTFNPKPSIPAQDDGTWRRLMMLHFGVQIPEDQQDKHLRRKLAAEAAGILNWLLDGYRMWAEQGVAPPESVKGATAEYRAENDPVGGFLLARTRKTMGVNMPAKELYDEFKKYCEANGIDPIMSGTAFGRRMVDKGYEKMKVGNMYYRNIELLASDANVLTANEEGMDL